MPNSGNLYEQHTTIKLCPDFVTRAVVLSIHSRRIGDGAVGGGSGDGGWLVSWSNASHILAKPRCQNLNQPL